MDGRYPQIARLMGPTWGPPGSCRPQMGPMFALWTLLSGSISQRLSSVAHCPDSVCCIVLTVHASTIKLLMLNIIQLLWISELRVRTILRTNTRILALQKLPCWCVIYCWVVIKSLNVHNQQVPICPYYLAQQNGPLECCNRNIAWDRTLNHEPVAAFILYNASAASILSAVNSPQPSDPVITQPSVHNITYTTAVDEIEPWSKYEITKDIRLICLMNELWTYLWLFCIHLYYLCYYASWKWFTKVYIKIIIIYYALLCRAVSLCLYFGGWTQPVYLQRCCWHH